MRMWMIDPTLLCRQHLLGEHRELHALATCINEGISLEGYCTRKIIQPKSIVDRHAKLVQEMKRRGWKHKTPLGTVYLINLPLNQRLTIVSKSKSMIDLQKRCFRCRERIERS